MDRTDIRERDLMKMRRMAGLRAAAGAGLRLSHCHAYASDGASQRWRFLGGRFSEVSSTNSGVCIGFPDGGPPVTGARLVQERCDQVPEILELG
jgi:hypothetical protein